jgi:hypothetical protein
VIRYVFDFVDHVAHGSEWIAGRIGRADVVHLEESTKVKWKSSPGVSILAEGSCPIPPSGGSVWFNPKAEIKTVPCWLRIKLLRVLSIHVKKPYVCCPIYAVILALLRTVWTSNKVVRQSDSRRAIRLVGGGDFASIDVDKAGR